MLLPNDFAEYIHNIGNARDLHSIIQGGLIPGGKVSRGTGSQCFFTAVNPMYPNQDLEEVQYDLDKRGTAVYKNTWIIHQNTVYWCKLKLTQRKGLQFYQTPLFSTHYLRFVLRKWYMKTGEDLCCKAHQSPWLPRVVFTPNLQYGRQDPPDPEARKSTDHHSEQSVQCRETCRGENSLKTQLILPLFFQGECDPKRFDVGTFLV